MSRIQKSVVVFERLDDNALKVAMGIARICRHSLHS